MEGVLASFMVRAKEQFIASAKLQIVNIRVLIPQQGGVGFSASRRLSRAKHDGRMSYAPFAPSALLPFLDVGSRFNTLR